MNKISALPYQEDNSIVIFDAGLIRRIKLKSRLQQLSTFLLALSFFGISSLGAPIFLTELNHRLNKNSVRPVSTAKTFGDIVAQNNLGEFSLSIPKIHLSSKVFPNIDPMNKKIYLPVLRQGVAHAAGTYFPGEGGLVYLFAHSADYVFNIKQYNALFYNLKDLEVGDEISLSYQGRKFNYKVSEKKIVEATEVSVLKNTGEEKLILQTCWPPGTTWKRLLVIATPA